MCVNMKHPTDTNGYQEGCKIECLLDEEQKQSLSCETNRMFKLCYLTETLF